MSNEELASAAKGGDQTALLALWENVKRFAKWKANRYGGDEKEDLLQAAFEGFLAAVKHFDSDRGNFLHLYGLFLHRAFAGACGVKENDPLRNAVSLDTPIGEDENTATLADMIPDPTRFTPAEAAEREEIAATVRASVDTLPRTERDVIRCRYFACMTPEETAVVLGISATEAKTAERAALRLLRHPSIRKKLHALL